MTTVSHSLNGRGRVQPDTRSRVLRAAERLGYAANAHAQRLSPDSADYIQALNDTSAVAPAHG